MILRLVRDGSNITTYVNLDHVYNIVECNGIFEFKQGSSTIASFAVANTTVSYCNNGTIVELPKDANMISKFILTTYAG